MVGDADEARRLARELRLVRRVKKNDGTLEWSPVDDVAAIEAAITAAETRGGRLTVNECARELLSAAETLGKVSEKLGDTPLGRAALVRAQHYIDAADLLAVKFGLKGGEVMMSTCKISAPAGPMRVRYAPDEANEDVTVTMTRLTDGAAVTFQTRHPYAGADADSMLAFLWSDGNWGCDCNRGIEWIQHAEKREAKDDETPCGSGTYHVAIHGADGRLIYADDCAGGSA